MVNASLTIGRAPGVPTATLDGNHGSSAAPCTTASCDGPVLAVLAGVDLNINDLVIQNADDLTAGSEGGGLKNVGGTVTVTNLTFNNDRAGSQGGAVYNPGHGTMTVTGSTFTGNQADEGGAIANGPSGTVTVMGSTFSGNHAVFTGGAIDNADNSFGVGTGQLTVLGSTFADNSARDGGAIDNAFGSNAGSGQVSISGSTFSGNTASDDGGAIDSADNLGDGSATVTVTDSTFAGNSATNHGGAIDNADVYDGTGINAGNATVVASTLTGDAASVGPEIDNDFNPNVVSVAADVLAGACAAGVTDGGYNVASDATCLGGAGGDVVVGSGLSADLGPLAFTGGPTQTAAPVPTAANPVVGIIPQGTPPVTLNGSMFTLCPTTDQRGAPSPPAKGCDPGAVQTPLLTVRAPSQSITYGSPVPRLPPPSAAGFVLGQDQSALAAPPTCAVAGPLAGAGAYPIVCLGAQNASGSTPAAPDTDYEFVYVPGLLTIARAPQTIVFAAPPRNPVAGGDLVVSAAGGASGNPVVFSIDPRTSRGACSLGADGTTLYFEHAGNCVLDAGQAGNHNYLAGTASETIVVGRNVPADRFYWADFESGTIREESGSGPASTLFRGQSHPSGVAVDLAAGKIYWTDTGAGTILVGNLDGSGRPRVLFAGESTPLGLAIDPAHDKLYWSEYNADWDNKKPGAIRVGNLNGSRPASTLFAGQYRPTGVALDPARGTIYWTDYKTNARTSAGAIRAGRLTGIGVPTTLFLDSGGPAGLAISPTQGEIYWSDIRSGSLRTGPVDRSGAPDTVLSGDNSPFGVAIDPAQGDIFWTDYHKSNRASTGAIRMRLLSASGLALASVVPSLFAGESGPTFLAVAGAPAATAPPVVSGGRSTGRALACTLGRWASDVLGASFYRAPRRFSYRWRRDHAAIPGATAARYTPPVAGSYSCTVTAINQAGATTRTSAPVSVGAASGR